MIPGLKRLQLRLARVSTGTGGRLRRQLAGAAATRDRAQNDHLRLGLNAKNSQLAFIEFDTSGSITFWNSAAEKLFGYGVDEAIGMKVAVLRSPTQQVVSEKEQAWKKLLTAGEGAIRRSSCRRKDGQDIIVESHNIPLIDHHGQTVGLASILQDVTDQVRDIEKRMEAEYRLAEHKQLLDTVIESMPIAVFSKSINDDFRISIWNKAAEELFGILAKDYIGKNDYEFFPKEQADHFRQVDLEVVRAGGIVDIPEESANTGAGPATLRTRKTIIRDATGKPQYLLGICQDISKEKQQQAALELQRAMVINSAKLASLGEMAAGIAHEINNPLAIIAGRARLAAKKFEAQPEVVAAFQDISNVSNRIATIIRGLRTFARDGDADPMEPCRVADFVAEAVALCREKIKSVGIDLREGPIDPQVRITGRSVQLSQVIMNLIGNAVDAVDALNEPGAKGSQRWIETRVEATADQVRVFVSDSGPGVPAELRAKIMQPFFSTKAVGKGSGLGLSISSGIVQQHGGRLELDEKAAHTTFVLTVPRLEA